MANNSGIIVGSALRTTEEKDGITTFATPRTLSDLDAYHSFYISTFYDEIVRLSDNNRLKEDGIKELIGKMMEARLYDIRNSIRSVAKYGYKFLRIGKIEIPRMYDEQYWEIIKKEIEKAIVKEIGTEFTITIKRDMTNDEVHYNIYVNWK